MTVTLRLWRGYAVQAVAYGHEVHLCTLTLSTETMGRNVGDRSVDCKQWTTGGKPSGLTNEIEALAVALCQPVLHLSHLGSCTVLLVKGVQNSLVGQISAHSG